MAGARLQLALVLGAIQAVTAESNFMYKMVKSTVCSSVKIPFVCSGGDSKSGNVGSSFGGGSSDSGSSSKCSGDSCCAGSSCYSLPGMGCDSSRGSSVRCAGSSLPFTSGLCQCKNGASCSEGTCSSSSGGSGMMSQMESDLSDLFEESRPVARVPREDHSRALALYTGGACLLVIAGLSAGVRKLRRRGSAEGAAELELDPRWDLLSQVSSSGE